MITWKNTEFGVLLTQQLTKPTNQPTNWPIKVMVYCNITKAIRKVEEKTVELEKISKSEIKRRITIVWKIFRAVSAFLSQNPVQYNQFF